MRRWAEMQPDWAFGYEDETWWSRVKSPNLHAWAEADQPLRLLAHTLAQDDPDPKALACYGLLVCAPADLESLPQQVWLRFVQGHAVGAVTIQFLEWCCMKLQAVGKKALLLLWDNASWHVSGQVRAWMRAHNHQVRQQRMGVRLVVCGLPTKSPWLNPLEPRWMHGKRHVAEPARLLTAQELAERVCAHFNCAHETHLAVPEKVV